MSAAGAELRFLGGAGTVTGSKYLLTVGATRILIDCGLFQGVKNLRLRNWQPLPFDAAALDAVVLTHAHLDHSGHVPALIKSGYPGTIHCTPPTLDLCRVLWPDAGKIQEEDARYATRKGFSKHRPALPLYTQEEGEEACERLRSVAFGETLRVGEVRVRFRPAGHILGAASVEVSWDAGRLLFSGDLGRSEDLVMHPPQPPGTPDWLVVESTYGDRLHRDADPIEELGEITRRTLSRGGILLIPSFAVGRAQTLLYGLHEMFRRKLAPRVPVFLNSPMATAATHLFREYSEYHRLDDTTCDEVFESVHYVRSVDESKALTERREPAIILSASGMATGGRVLHHLKTLAPDARNTIALPGFQAPGTRGDALAHGANRVKIHGSYVPVSAEVVMLDLFSAHADQDDLVGWVAGCTRPPKQVFVTHGEPAPADALRLRIHDEAGFEARVPELGDAVKLA